MPMETLLANPSLAIFGLGTTELIIILIVVLLLFGGAKLPALAQSMGASINSFKKGMREGGDDAAKPAADAKTEPKHDAHSH